MRAQLPVNCTILEEEFPSLFKKWDINGDGSLDANELLDPSRGLLTYIMQRYPRVQQENTPDLKSDKNAWFRYFDYDKYIAARLASPPMALAQPQACEVNYALCTRLVVLS